jgi:hypothetical protein
MTETSRTAAGRPWHHPGTRRQKIWRTHSAAASSVLLFLSAGVALAVSGVPTTSAVLKAPLATAVGCVEDVLVNNGYRLPHGRPEQASGAANGERRTENLTAIRLADTDELRWYVPKVLKDGRARIDYGLIQTTVTLVPIDTQNSRVVFRSSILAFMFPGIPLMRPSRLFPLQSKGRLETDLLASLLKRSRCAGLPAPSSPSH